MARDIDPIQAAINRRQFLKRSAVYGAGGALLASGGLGAFLAACQNAGTSSGSAVATASAAVSASATAAASASAAAGKLLPWDPNVAIGSTPSLPARVASSFPVATIEFWQRCIRSMEKAGKDLGLEFISADAANDAAKTVEQNQAFMQRGVGAIVFHPIEVNAQATEARKAIDAGLCVLGNVFVPSHCHDSASQYRIGKNQGLAAAKYIQEALGGEAQVLLYNADHIEALQGMATGMREGLATVPGARIVTEVQNTTGTKDDAFELASTALQQYPDINVVVGWDTYSLGALAAFRAAGKAKDDMWFSGVDGDVEAFAEIKKNGPYKASFAWPMETLSYAWVQFAADWLNGKSIPKVIDLDVAPVLGAEGVDAFNAAMADPAKNWQNSIAIKYLGNISYDTRTEFLTEIYPVE